VEAPKEDMPPEHVRKIIKVSSWGRDDGAASLFVSATGSFAWKTCIFSFLLHLLLLLLPWW
jgi:hypothetical protein